MLRVRVIGSVLCAAAADSLLAGSAKWLDPLQATAPTASSACSLRDYGAKGDGETDDSEAVAKAFATCAGSVVLIPPGAYRITKTISVPTGGSLQVRGEGWGSVLLWDLQGDLLTWESAASHLSMKDFAIASAGEDKDPAHAAMRFKADCTQSYFDHLLFYGAGSLPNFPQVAVKAFGTAMDLGPVTDTVQITGCDMWNIKGTGVRIGRGSEVRINGGRIIGLSPGGAAKDENIGVHVTGDNGGVHIMSTDIIGHYEGLRLDSSNGQGANREIFVTHATFDSSTRGIAVYDSSYISIAGIWSASCLWDNIWVSPDAGNPILAIAGGTIFNGGSEGSADLGSQANGITVNAGTFSLSGVIVRNNKGRGLWVANDQVKQFSVTGCKFYGNGQDVKIADNSEAYSFVGNVIEGSAEFGSKGGGAVVANNVMPNEHLEV